MSDAGTVWVVIASGGFALATSALTRWDANHRAERRWAREESQHRSAEDDRRRQRQLDLYCSFIGDAQKIFRMLDEGVHSGGPDGGAFMKTEKQLNDAFLDALQRVRLTAEPGAAVIAEEIAGAIAAAITAYDACGATVPQNWVDLAENLGNARKQFTAAVRPELRGETAAPTAQLG